MTGAVRRSLTIGLLGLLLAGASCASAQTTSDARLPHRKLRRLPRIVLPPPLLPMPDPVPPEISERRHDGHMNPEERRLLRQHIEDAVRELYKR